MFTKSNPAIGLCLLLISIISSQSVLAIGKYEITPEKLHQEILLNKSHLIIDLRDQDKYQQSHIPSAINIRHDNLKNKLHALLPYKNKSVILYCGDGTRSAIGMTVLRKEGFKKLLNVHGNMFAWEKKKLPVSTKINSLEK